SGVPAVGPPPSSGADSPRGNELSRGPATLAVRCRGRSHRVARNHAPRARSGSPGEAGPNNGAGREALVALSTPPHCEPRDVGTLRWQGALPRGPAPRGSVGMAPDYPHAPRTSRPPAATT